MANSIQNKIKPDRLKITPINIVNLLNNQKGVSWLDSSLFLRDKGRKSIIGCNPVGEISSDGNTTYIHKYSEKRKISSTGNIFDLLEHMVAKGALTAIGYISYEGALQNLELPFPTRATMPLIRFFLYDSVLTYDNLKKEFIEPLPQSIIDALIDSPEQSHCTAPVSTVHETVDKENYINNVRKIKNHIKEGDIYQANYTGRFTLESESAPFEIYKRLRQLNPAPYSAYINFGDSRILSSSPERMFTREKNKITSCPIKGTIALGATDREQHTNIQKLLTSSKDRAELLMIVDLVRNDLGKIARHGSVAVDSIFETETYSSLIHMVSDISAEFKTDVSLKKIIAALLPGGSITGAPKKRAVEILNQLENCPRAVYTGCIGYVSQDRADFNIAIRTMYHSENRYYIHAGGGIVADSDPETEYAEMLLKAKNLFTAIGHTHA